MEWRPTPVVIGNRARHHASDPRRSPAHRADGQTAETDMRSPRVVGGAAPGPGLRLIDRPVHLTVRTKSYGARNRPRETVGGLGPKFVSSRVSRLRSPAVSRPDAPEPRRFRRAVSWTSVCREAGGGAEGNRTPDLDIANVALSQLSYGPTVRTGCAQVSRWLPAARGRGDNVGDASTLSSRAWRIARSGLPRAMELRYTPRRRAGRPSETL